jgi:serine protease
MVSRIPFRAFTLLLVVVAGCSDDPTRAPVVPTSLSLSRAQGIPTRAEERPGTLAELSDDELWVHISASGGVAAVGLRAPGAVRGVYRGQILITGSQRSEARRAVLAQRGVELLRADDLLPVLELRLANREALRAIRRLPMVDYVEPTATAEQELPQFASTGGCGYGSLWTGDRQYTAGGDVYSQKLAAMNVPAAWGLSNGTGVTIGLTDTGLASTQQQLLGQFAMGESAGRTLALTYVPSKSSPYDRCGHGTRMAGVIAAPRDGYGVVGVAWGANLVSVRQADGVANVSSSDAKYSVRIAARSGARIIVTGWQSMNWWWQVSDEIKYWHYNRPILFVGAAGTSRCGDGILDSNVVFPADMSEVVAVTGQRYPDGAIPCGVHYGKDVELTAYLDVPTSGQYTRDVVTIGGSSNATAIIAGIAALVWSRNPSLTRDQLRRQLWSSGALYPNRSGTRGYGIVDAYKAVVGN